MIVIIFPCFVVKIFIFILMFKLVFVFIQQINVRRMISHKQINFLVPYLLQRVQIIFSRLKSRISNFVQIIRLKGVKAKAAIISCACSLFSVRNIEETHDTTFRVSRNQIKFNGRIAKCPYIPFFDCNVHMK